MTEILRRWLAEFDGPSLFLPWGWYGRPYDNVHELTASLLTPGQVALQFDHSLLVVATIEVDSLSGRSESPAATDGWTTLTADGITLLMFISSDSESANWDEATIQSDRDSFFVLVAPPTGAIARVDRGA
jgi:hypothetical protein